MQVIAHRGASGHRPEHTLAAYRLAVRMDADYIEPDLVPTRDGVLVARHENEISATTDIARRPEFAGRRTTKLVDGVMVSGWFTEDLTLAELRTLRAVERLPGLRPANTRFDGWFRIPTFAEILDLAEREGARRGRPVGVYPETKHPTYFARLGLDTTALLLAELRRRGLDHPAAPVWVQSFEVGNLRRLAETARVRLVQLVGATGAPYDLICADPSPAGDGRTYADLASPAGLAEVASYAHAVGVAKELVHHRDATGRLGAATSLVADAHAVGLEVHAWTVRAEERFLPRGADVATELRALHDAGVDGVFADHPDLAVAVRDARVLSPAS